MKTLIKNAYVYMAEEMKFIPANVVVEGKYIQYVGSDCPIADEVIDVNGKMVTPGFVDIHTHGRGGMDFLDVSPRELDILSNLYAQEGTTSLMPTLASDTLDNWIIVCDRIRKTQTSGAHFLGIHLEGRYLNPVKRGAHALHLLQSLDVSELESLFPHLGERPHISAAFELDQNGQFAKTALQHGATLSLGHTNATYEETQNAMEEGVTSFTHLFNAMPALHHRQGGAVCAALLSDAYIELICDGLHVSPEMIQLAYRVHNPKYFVLVTDSISAAGMPNGNYSVAGTPVQKVGDKILTEDGALGGSNLTLRKAVENLMRFCNIPFEKALYHATLAPAKVIGRDHEVGCIKPGARADLLVISLQDGIEKNIELDRIMVGGIWRE